MTTAALLLGLLRVELLPQLILLLLDMGGQDLFQPLVKGCLQGISRLRFHSVGIKALVEIPDPLLLALG